VSSSLKEMTWHGRAFNVYDAATTAEQEVLLQHLTRISPVFNYEKHSTIQQLKQFSSLMEQLQLHTVNGAYVWQYFKDPAQLNLPPLPLQTAPHSLDTTEGAPADTSDVLPVPAPVPVWELSQEVLSQEQECEVGKLYASFFALYQYAPDYGHAPFVNTLEMRDMPREMQLHNGAHKPCDRALMLRSVCSQISMPLSATCAPRAARSFPSFARRYREPPLTTIARFVEIDAHRSGTVA
jgi:hypothetical protein